MYLPSFPVDASDLSKRYYRNCNDGFGGYGNCSDSWGDWGRYVVLAGVIVVALILFFVVACISARRRRRRGATPYYGTGWIPGTHGNVNYYPQNENNTQPQQPYYTQQNYGQTYGQQPAPPYSPSGNQQSYYGNRGQDGVELQPPASTYQPQTGGTPVYAPPEGPPPSKKGDVLR